MKIQIQAGMQFMKSANSFSAKDIVVKPISKTDADVICKKYHYSGKVVANSRLNLGCFLNNKCFGIMQFGCPIDIKKTVGLVRNTKWNDFLELNRMAFSEVLPRNSESRCISIAFRIIKKNYPNIKWVISYADACQCGDGSIYRASGFILTLIKENSGLWKMQDGTVMHSVSAYHKYHSSSALRKMGAKKLEGYQLRYVYFLDKNYRKFLTVPEIPFSKIKELKIGMYKGEKKTY